jgi:hypothetical protein
MSTTLIKERRRRRVNRLLLVYIGRCRGIAKADNWTTFTSLNSWDSRQKSTNLRERHLVEFISTSPALAVLAIVYIEVPFMHGRHLHNVGIIWDQLCDSGCETVNVVPGNALWNAMAVFSMFSFAIHNAWL